MHKKAIEDMLFLMENPVFCFTGGGTGGHVYPAKPVIDILKASEDHPVILWIGSKGGMEEEIIKRWDITYIAIPSGKFRRYFSFRNLTDLFRILAGFFKARKVLKNYQPQWIFSKGGFVSVPPVFAAKSLKIPVYSHDSDLDPGLATRLNSPRSNAIFIPYEESRKYYQKWSHKVHVSGNPVRKDFYEADAVLGKSFLNYQGGKPILLVIGGSLGAQQINLMIQTHLDWLCERFFVVHQTGSENFKQSDRDGYRTYSFIHEEIPHVMKSASLAFSRAGAGTLWELALTKTPMILLPLTKGSRGDQFRNGTLFEKMGFAKLLKETNLTDEVIWDIFESMSPEGEEGKRAASVLSEKPLSDGAEEILRIIEKETHL